MAKRRVQLGSTGEAVRRHLANLRQVVFPTWGKAREGVYAADDPAMVTKVELARRLADTSRPLTANTVSEIENGARRVDVDDLTALAAALDTSPLFLLLPWQYREGDTIDLAGVGEVSTRRAWAWMRDGIPVDQTERAGADRILGIYVDEQHDDEVAHRRDVLRAMVGDEVDGSPGEVAHDLEVAFWRRLIEAGAIDRRVTFDGFRGHFERMMRELAAAEGIADRWGVELPPDPQEVANDVAKKERARNFARVVSQMAPGSARDVGEAREAVEARLRSVYREAGLGLPPSTDAAGAAEDEDGDRGDG